MYLVVSDQPWVYFHGNHKRVNQGSTRLRTSQRVIAVLNKVFVLKSIAFLFICLPLESVAPDWDQLGSWWWRPVDSCVWVRSLPWAPPCRSTGPSRASPGRWTAAPAAGPTWTGNCGCRQTEGQIRHLQKKDNYIFENGPRLKSHPVCNQSFEIWQLESAALKSQSPEMLLRTYGNDGVHYNNAKIIKARMNTTYLSICVRVYPEQMQLLIFFIQSLSMIPNQCQPSIFAIKLYDQNSIHTHKKHE